MALMDESVWRGKIYSGGWVGGDLGTGLDAPVIEPATGQEIGRTGIATPADVARAAQIAAAAQPAWAATPHTERSAILRRAADTWLAHAADIGILTRDVMRGLDLARRIPTGIVHVTSRPWTTSRTSRSAPSAPPARCRDRRGREPGGAACLPVT